MLKPEVFKAYDVRGIYPAEIDEEGAYAIGRAYVEEFKPKRIAIGRDMRMSGPQMVAALTEGATDGGADVLDIGQIGTEMLYFAVGSLESGWRHHLHRLAQPQGVHGLQDRARRRSPGRRRLGPDRGARSRPEGFGEVARRAPWRRRTLAGLSSSASSRSSTRARSSRCAWSWTRPTAWAAACSSRCSSACRRSTPCAATSSQTAVFPNHEPNPLLPENREFIVAKVKEEADLGIAFDGDADRCFFVDETGEFVPGDFVTALFAETFLAKEPGAKIIYDVRASWAVPHTIEQAGGIAARSIASATPSSSTACARAGAVFGGEVSAHYYFRDFSGPTRESSRPC